MVYGMPPYGMVKTHHHCLKYHLAATLGLMKKHAKNNGIAI